MSFIEPYDRSGQMNGSEEVAGGFVVTCGHGAKLLQFGEKVLDQMAGFVEVSVVDLGRPSGGSRPDCTARRPLVLKPPRDRAIAWSPLTFFGHLHYADGRAQSCCRSSRIRFRRRPRDAGTRASGQRTGPSAVQPMHVLPIAEPLRKVAPGNACAVTIQHRLDKQPVALGRHTHMPLASRERIRELLPLVVTESIASHKSDPSRLTI